MTLHPATLFSPGPVTVHFTTEVPVAAEVEGLFAEIDGAAINSRDELLDAIAAQLEFPAYFGHNWDALEECLRDLSWLPASGYVLVVRTAGDFWHDHPGLAGRLAESWQLCAADWVARGTAFHLVYEW
jgi:hypothetical protein